MTEADTAESPLEAAAGAIGPDAVEAFSLLADETRLSILLALWERYDPHADDTHGAPGPVSFTELFERVDYDNPGNFRYHLKQLEGQFIRQRAERGGYELRMPGLKLVQTIIAGAGAEAATLEPTVTDQPCPHCGAATAVSYREGLVVQACTECAGPAPERTDTDGFLHAVKFQPAGVAGRSPEAVRTASWKASMRQLRSMFDGLCPTCSGAVDGWLDCCAEHDPSRRCDRCGTRFVAWARFQCRVCKDHGNASPKVLALFHPAVVALYHDQGVSMRVDADDVEGASRCFDLMDAHGMELRSVDPPRLDVSVEHGGERLRLTFDETVSVVDVDR